MAPELTQKGCSEETLRRDYLSCHCPQALGHLWQHSSSSSVPSPTADLTNQPVPTSPMPHGKE